MGVLICSYQRPASLLRGLLALAAQERSPDDVIVVARRDDFATLEALRERRRDALPLRVLTVTTPGTVYALNTGLDACITDILSITDDDTVPHPDWLSRILAHFVADPGLGGLSGRDWVHDGERFDDDEREVVGRLQWFGRSVGNHHLGVGPAREVDFFKGANMSYRTEALADVRFDTRLRGSGAQPCEDLAFSLSVRVSGWKLVYDPMVAIDHYPAPRNEPRHYGGSLDDKDTAGLSDFAYNEATALWRGLSWPRRCAYMVWSIGIGTGVLPGLLQAIRFTPQLRSASWTRFGAVGRGRTAAFKDALSLRWLGPSAARVASKSTPPTRIAMFHATLPEKGRKLGGVEATVHRLANALVQHGGCRVTMFSCGMPPDDALYEHSVIRSNASTVVRLGRLVYLPLRLNAIDFSSFDLLHLHGDDWFFFNRRVPTVRTLHGSALFESRFAQNWRRKLLQGLIYPLEHISSRLATIRIAVGTEAATLYKAAGLANNGVDNKVFYPRRKDCQPLLFYIGTWQGRKRGEFAYRVFLDQILPVWPMARLYMACDGVPHHPNVIDGKFPSQQELADWMARAWLFFYPSLYEGFGIAYVEAMSSGTAIVTSPNSGAAYVLEDGRYGVVCGDDEFGGVINRMLGDDLEREDLAQRGVKRADRFSWKKVAEEHMEVYRAAITKFSQ